MERRVLVVDDDHSWQEILGELLQDEGLTVDYAETVPAAQTALQAHSHRLAVVDLSLDPEDHRNQDGLAVLEAIRRLDPGCAAILLSGFTTVEVAVTALTRLGVFTVQRKEVFRRSLFRQAVHQALASLPGTMTEFPQPVAQLPVEKGADGAGSQGMALVVDDDAGWRGILAELLGDAGYRVRLCSGFGEALGWLRRDRPNLAVIDLSLGGAQLEPSRKMAVGEELEGARLLVSIRAAGIPAIVVSGITSPAEIERFYQELGVFAYLEKQTFDRRSFLQTVYAAHNRRQTLEELDVLTERERDVIKLIGEGQTNKEIADHLVISTNTVKRHLKAIFEKLKIHTRSAAAAKAAESSAD